MQREISIGDEMLVGAEQIAVFLFGSPKMRRRVYELAAKGQLPVFKLGEVLHARRSALRAHIEKQEKAALDSGEAA